MLETVHGEFDLIKNYREAFIMDDFNKRYIDILNVYQFIVGDYSAGMLRLKGFSKDTYNLIPDYLVESCAPNCAYFILNNPNFNPSQNRKE
ncbi:MAG: DUF1027 domain-containing protein [Bacilli bacterium]|nr:DUF1027 domain-containing protein [Bacilli bacterium]